MHETIPSLSDTSSCWFADEVAAATAPAAAGPGQVALVERSARRGAMAPLHRRDEDEAYRLIEGEVTFFVDDYSVPAQPGDVVVAPAGVPRTFRIESDRARWMVLTRVSSLERFVDFGRAVTAPAGDPAAGWQPPDDERRLAAMAAANGIELLGPPGALPRRAAESSSAS